MNPVHEIHDKIDLTVRSLKPNPISIMLDEPGNTVHPFDYLREFLETNDANQPIQNPD